MIISHGKLVASDTPDNLGKLAAGSNNLSLVVKGDKDKIRILLNQIPGIKEISIESSKDQEGWSIKLSTEENTDIREEVFYKMAENHYPILEMQSKKVSLEEIFLELTEDVAPSQPEKKKLFTRHKKAAAVDENTDNNAEASDEGSINTNTSDNVSATTGVNVSESSESKADAAATKEAE